VYVANNDKGSIIKIPVLADGSAGTPEIVAGPDCERLGGADGLARASDGSLWVAVNRQNRLVRIDLAGGIETVAENGALDFPASLAFGTVLSSPSLLVTSFALGEALSGGHPDPALVALPMD
jgi:sugar lactone lactonase YvrE